MLTVSIPPAQPIYNIPSVIPETHKSLFIGEAKKAGLTPDEFGTIAKREQGPGTLPTQIALVGKMDPNDRGVMQVNTINDKLVKQKFKEEYGRNYNPNSTTDSIIAARMVLQENRRQFEKLNSMGTYTEPYTNQDLIDSYNLGVKGLIKAKQGDKEKKAKLEHYQSIGKENG